jgi:hypothetical protein
MCVTNNTTLWHADNELIGKQRLALRDIIHARARPLSREYHCLRPCCSRMRRGEPII